MVYTADSKSAGLWSCRFESDRGYHLTKISCVLYVCAWGVSSVGQSFRLITGRSRVQTPDSPPFFSGAWRLPVEKYVENRPLLARVKIFRKVVNRGQARSNQILREAHMLKYTMFLLLLSCTSDKKTISTLEKAGFTDIEPRGYGIFSCSEDDFFQTNFAATNPQGMRVEGTVCCGLMKNCTIRY